PVQQPHDPPLFLQRRKGDLNRLQLGRSKRRLSDPAGGPALEEALMIQVAKKSLDRPRISLGGIDPHARHMIGERSLKRSRKHCRLATELVLLKRMSPA